MLVALLLTACSVEEEVTGVPALGAGTHDGSLVVATEMADEADGLDYPTDLAFNPEIDGELWIVNRSDDSVTVVSDAMGSPSSQHIVDPYALHFMDQVSSIDFGAPGTFGTCQDSQNTYNGNGDPNNFMGPTLWPSALDLFGTSNPDAVAYLTELYGFNVDLGSHIDMQHESPRCAGIAWESENVYWVVDGKNGEIDRVDFGQDHGLGFDDHSDGITASYVSGEMGYVEGIPSHMALDSATGLLWVADPGKNRIVALDTATGERGDDRRAQEPGTEHYEVDGATMYLMIDGEDFGMEQPSGLAMHDDLIYVGDFATGRLWAFDLDGGEVDYLDLGSPGLTGIEVVSADDLWVSHAEGNQVYRLQAAE